MNKCFVSLILACTVVSCAHAMNAPHAPRPHAQGRSELYVISSQGRLQHVKYYVKSTSQPNLFKIFAMRGSLRVPGLDRSFRASSHELAAMAGLVKLSDNQASR
jgi:hypothetical protein